MSGFNKSKVVQLELPKMHGQGRFSIELGASQRGKRNYKSRRQHGNIISINQDNLNVY